jgi:hypothetical protein
MRKHPKEYVYFCRTEKGGCGRKVVLVGESYTQINGAQRRPGVRPIAVHVDEVGERKIIKGSRQVMLRARIRLEDSCASRAERARTAELEKWPRASRVEARA